MQVNCIEDAIGQGDASVMSCCQESSPTILSPLAGEDGGERGHTISKFT